MAALGLHSAGGVLVPLNTRFKGHEAGDILDRGGARLLFTVTDFLDTDYVALLRGAYGPAEGDRPVAGLPGLERIVVLRGDVAAGLSELGRLPAQRRRRPPSEVADARAMAVSPDDLSDILFTSGTTGRPKGVMTTPRPEPAGLPRLGRGRRACARATAT